MLTLTKREVQVARHLDAESKGNKWRDYKWQLKHTIRDLDTIQKLLGITWTGEERADIQETTAKFPLAVTPYYLSLIDPKDFKNDPVYKQAIPSVNELQFFNYEMMDPLAEDKDSPVEGITHRYPDRVLFLISNTCSMYCRHCTRKRKVGDIDFIPDRKTVNRGLDYIRQTPVIRDVLLSGGDPFMLSDDYLDWILSELRAIPHLQIIRIGTRTPVVLPYRITDNLVKILKQYHPLWINTHFNHPREMTQSASIALEKLANAGIPLGNQSVLLAGVNDCPRIMKELVHKLVMNRVRPYYMYQCDLSEGISHFRTPISKGIEIIERLIGHTSGYAVPTYVIDAPGGGGKIPIMPNYLISWATNRVVLRNYEGVITTYREPDSYEPVFCDRNCESCKLQLKLDPADEYKTIGIEKLLVDYDQTISLIPSTTERVERRNGNNAEDDSLM
ncbi:lysine 2,3-aminomutase [bacterium]|nr:lysine 2,3-aminomutase [candidate division CSSED10-310 bacterium]